MKPKKERVSYGEKVQVRLAPGMVNDLDYACENYHLTRSEAIRLALWQWLEMMATGEGDGGQVAE